MYCVFTLLAVVNQPCVVYNSFLYAPLRLLLTADNNNSWSYHYCRDVAPRLTIKQNTEDISAHYVML